MTSTQPAARRVHQEGTGKHAVRVFERFNKGGSTFELRWTEVHPADPDRPRRTIGRIASFGEARATGEKLWSRYLSKGMDAPRATMPGARSARTVRQVAEDFLAQHPTDKPSTLEGYRSSFSNNAFADLVVDGRPINLGNMAIDAVEESDVNLWKRGLSNRTTRTGKPLSSSSVKAALRDLSPVFTFAIKKKYRYDNPVLAVSKGHRVSGRRVPGYFATEADFWTWMSHVEPKFKAPMVVGAYAGLRLAEVEGLLVEHVDFDGHRIWVSRTIDQKGRVGTTKSESSEDWVPLHPEAEKALRHHIDEYGRRRGQTVFHGQGGTRLHRRALQSEFRRACMEAGLVGITFHGLRHSLATWIADATGDVFQVQAALRHADIRTSMQYIKGKDKRKVTAFGALRGQ